MQFLRERIGLLAGIAAFIFFLLVNPFGVDPFATKVLAIAALMITWWIGEALPMPVVALVPMVLFPLMNIASLRETTSKYADPVIFLFMGGFMIGLAIEKWNLHKRIALSIVRLTGTSGDRIVLGFILATGLISMWLSNTATTMMMYPIAASVIYVVKENHKGQGNVAHFALTIMLAIAYASNFGGVATIVGTPPNGAFVGFMREKYNYVVPFIDWMLICMPLAILLLFALYFVMKWMYPNKIVSSDATRNVIRKELKDLGPVTAGEKRVLIIFCITAFLWIAREPLGNITWLQNIGWARLDDNMIAIAGAIALFMCPSGKNNGSTSKYILEWSDTSKMAWGILLLFGGGIALAFSLEKAGLIQSLGQWIAGMSGTGGLLLIFMIVLVSLFLSEVMSNIAQVIVFAPVIAGMADVLNMNPLLLGLPMTLAASCASMMPMGTPPNAIVFASGHIQLKQMIRVGFVMNIVAVILITLFCWLLVPILMGD